MTNQIAFLESKGYVFYGDPPNACIKPPCFHPQGLSTDKLMALVYQHYLAYGNDPNSLYFAHQIEYHYFKEFINLPPEALNLHIRCRY